jgi:hypothetical protein
MLVGTGTGGATTSAQRQHQNASAGTGTCGHVWSCICAGLWGQWDSVTRQRLAGLPTRHESPMPLLGLDERNQVKHMAIHEHHSVLFVYYAFILFLTLCLFRCCAMSMYCTVIHTIRSIVSTQG